MRGKKVLFILSLTVLVLFLLVGVFADFLAPCDPNAVDMANGLAAPSTEHWLGTDHIGRDLLSRLTAAALLCSSLSSPPDALCCWA